LVGSGSRSSPEGAAGKSGQLGIGGDQHQPLQFGLARRIKAGGYRLRYVLGLDAAELPMYSDLASLWEGWTKNWLLGLDGSLPNALGAAAVVAPAGAIAAVLLWSLATDLRLVLPLLVAVGLALVGIGL
jgi:hypothetical protein